MTGVAVWLVLFTALMADLLLRLADAGLEDGAWDGLHGQRIKG